MKRFLRISLLLALAAVTSSVWAQPPEFDDTLPPMYRGKYGEKMSANVENLRMMKLLETVDLSEEQSEKFVPLFHGFRKDIKSLIHERNALIDGIKELIAAAVPDDRIKEELRKLKLNRVQFNNRQDKFISDCETILTTPQLARLVIFQERFEREMLQSLREFRRHGGWGPTDKKSGKL